MAAGFGQWSTWACRLDVIPPNSWLVFGDNGGDPGVVPVHCDDADAAEADGGPASTSCVGTYLPFNSDASPDAHLDLRPYFHVPQTPWAAGRHAFLLDNGERADAEHWWTTTVEGPEDTTPPTPPTSFLASFSDINDTSVSSHVDSIRWSGATDDTCVAFYKVFRDGVFYAVAFDGFMGESRTTFGLDGVDVTIVAVDIAGNESEPSAPFTVVVPTFPDPGADAGVEDAGPNGVGDADAGVDIADVDGGLDIADVDGGGEEEEESEDDGIVCRCARPSSASPVGAALLLGMGVVFRPRRRLSSHR